MQNTVAATLDIFVDTPNINAWIFDRLRPWCGQRVLEVGAGIGNLTELLSDRELVLSTELEDDFIRRLERRFAGRPHIVPSKLDLASVDVPALKAERLDTVLCVNVLEHVQDDERALRDLGQAVVPGGRLLLYVPALSWLYGSIDRGLQHHRRYDRAELEAKLRRAGWNTVHMSWMNLLGIPGWFLNSRVLGRTMLPARQVKLYDRLTPVLRCEDWIRLPFGMSLVAVAESTAPS
jgi:SAM-dependent methyltransferase